MHRSLDCNSRHQQKHDPTPASPSAGRQTPAASLPAEQCPKAPPELGVCVVPNLLILPVSHIQLSQQFAQACQQLQVGFTAATTSTPGRGICRGRSCQPQRRLLQSSSEAHNPVKKQTRSSDTFTNPFSFESPSGCSSQELVLSTDAGADVANCRLASIQAWRSSPPPHPTITTPAHTCSGRLSP